MENTIISYPSRAEKKNSTDFPSCIKEIVLLCLFFFLSAQLSAQTPVAPSSGSGSVGDPYEITTLNNLYWIAATDTGFLRLTELQDGMPITFKPLILMRLQHQDGLVVLVGHRLETQQQLLREVTMVMDTLYQTYL